MIDAGGRQSWRGANLLYCARRLGLTSGLKLVLDAGDAASYSSGQSWLDLSGNGYDFFRGTTSGAEGSDPTFNGTAGNRSSAEYFSTDGGDRFTYDSANETWMTNLHKDNAKFTLAFWANIDLAAVAIALLATSNAAAGIGLQLRVNASNAVQIQQGNGSANTAMTGSGVVPDAAWAMIAASLDEAVGANGALLFCNGVADFATSTYGSPSASAPDGTLTIGCEPDGGAPAPTGSRFAGIMAWEGVALTQGQLNALWNATRGRFGI